MTFEQWWAEVYEPGFRETVPVLMLTFKEIAEKAWYAGCLVGRAEARSEEGV